MRPISVIAIVEQQPLSESYFCSRAKTLFRCRYRWFVVCDEDSEGAARGATSIACVGCTPDSGGRKEGGGLTARAVTGLQTGRR
jgi:hypothetical protein